MLDPTSLLRTCAVEIRQRFAEYNIPYVHISVEIDGPVDHGDLKLMYKVGSDYSDSVKSHSLSEALREFFRRNGWTKVNAPLCIGYAESANTEQTIDDIMEASE